MSPEELLAYNAGQISTLDSRLWQEVEQFMRAAWAKAWYFKIVSARRTVAQQIWLYASGRTRPGPIVTDTIFGSKHLSGLAIDILPTGGESLEDLGTLAAQFGGSRPLADLPGLQDKDHFEFAIPATVPEPLINQTPQARMAALIRGLKRAAGENTRQVIQFTIDQLKKRLSGKS